ncbi:MAG: MATE family efflux transporter [Spirochaetales bacterium]|nr:MATE family efflux transporter [Spirochaetales bacterium]
MSNMEDKKENVMGTLGITRLIMKMSLPLMISMLIQALYNIVDSMFVARVSETALTAVSLAFPLQNLLIAFGVGTGVGMASYLSRKLGEKDTETATKAAGNGITLAIITWVLFALLGLTIVKPFMSFFTEDPELLGLSKSYSEIVMVLSLFMLISMMNERILQGTGDSFSSMISQMTGAITNIILDPIFIFTFKMGVNGAAIATVIGQAAGCFVSLYFVIRNKYINIKPNHLKLEKRMVASIYAVGAPTIITNSIGTVMTGAMNAILIAFSTTAVSVFSVYFKLQSFVFMPIFGLSSGMVPIIAYNYGARKKKRVMSTIWIGTFIAIVIMAFGTLVFNLFPEALLSLFSATEEMYRLGVPALKIISLCFVSAAISIGLGSSFQATGYGIGTMIVSISRQLLVLVPVAFILSKLIGINGVWLSFIIAEGVGLTVSILLFIKVYRTRIKEIEEKVTLKDS